VSIIVPCKNAAPWLADTIDSCLSQTWPKLELIIVDDGSSDGTLAVAKQYESPSVKVFECMKNGASAARNVGLSQMRGDFVQFLDADDVLDHDKIRVQVERLGRLTEGTIANGAWSHFQTKPADAVFSAEPVWRDFAPKDFLISSWLGGGMMPSFAWLAPRQVIEKAGPWNEDLSVNDDGEFFTRAVLASAGVVFCADSRGYYRKLPTSTLSRRRDRQALTSAFMAVELSCRHLLERYNSNEVKGACACHFQRLIFDMYPQMPELIAAAERSVIELGGTKLKMGGGTIFRILCRCFGWKFARRCQLAWHFVQKGESTADSIKSPSATCQTT
jgi:hypothetical protein